MAVRLHLKIGLVAERDRLESSPDSALVTEPSVGSTSRSKGSLYVVVTASAGSGGRPHEATRVVADTIRREYYYDESAGIPICLQKALRSANRRLRHGREGHGLAAGSIGAVVAVVRGYELYVASTGDAEAYLVRQARLLTLPAEDRGEGLPTAEDVRVGVWRGEIAVGDSLILVSGNLTRTVGTDELKNAVVTLHPQSAVEHLHHLFVAGGGTGSDAILALEATEVAATRTERKLVPVRAPEPLAGAPERSPIPLADPLVAAASAVQDRAREAREAAGGAVFGLVDRLTELLPRRGMRYRHIAPQSSRREAQQRAAVAFLSLLLFVALVMVVLWVFGGLRRDDQIPPVIAGENAFAAARQRLNEAMPNGQLAAGDRERTLKLLREAWAHLRSAQHAGVPEARLRPLRTSVAAGLDRLYIVRHSAARTTFAFTRVSRQPDMADLVRGPDGASYSIDRSRRSVVRVDPTGRRATEVVAVGDGPGDGIAVPWQLVLAGPDILILDNRGGLWRWRPSDTTGRGTLTRVRVGGNTPWGNDVRDASTYVRNPDAGLYNFYVVDPSARQILRYLPAADGSGFPSEPTGYLATATDVSGFRQLYIDGDIYALTSKEVIRHANGRAESFTLQPLPDHGDLRPGHDFRFFLGTGDRRQGRLYIWDALHSRIVVFNKSDGAYMEQFVAQRGSPPFRSLRGMYLVERARRAPVLVWLTRDRLISSTLQEAPAPRAAPRASPAPRPRPTPAGSPSTP